MGRTKSTVSAQFCDAGWGAKRQGRQIWELTNGSDVWRGSVGDQLSEVCVTMYNKSIDLGGTTSGLWDEDPEIAVVRYVVIAGKHTR